MRNSTNIFQNSLHSCVSPLLKHDSNISRFGLLFGLPLLAQSPLSLEFLTHMVLPGCSLVGLKASLEPITPVIVEMRKQLRRMKGVMLFTVPEVELFDWDDGPSEVGIPGEIVISDWKVIYEKDNALSNLEHTHWLRFQKSSKTEPRGESVLKALLRVIAYSAAYPERLPDTKQPETAALLLELAGSRRTQYAVRLSRSVNAFSNGDISKGLYHLREAVMLAMRLSALVQSALMSQTDEKLDGIECQELIYLARAGTLEMKILAAARLRNEVHSQDVRNTLSELRRDPHAWVRAAAKIC